MLFSLSRVARGKSSNDRSSTTMSMSRQSQPASVPRYRRTVSGGRPQRQAINWPRQISTESVSASNSSRTEERMPAFEMALTMSGNFGPFSVLTQSPSVRMLASATMNTKVRIFTASSTESGPCGVLDDALSIVKPVTPMLSVRPPSSSLM